MTTEELTDNIDEFCRIHNFTQEDGTPAPTCDYCLKDGKIVSQPYFTLTSSGPKAEGQPFELWYSDIEKAIEAFKGQLYGYAKLQPRIIWRCRPEVIRMGMRAQEDEVLYQVRARLVTTERSK